MSSRLICGVFFALIFPVSLYGQQVERYGSDSGATDSDIAEAKRAAQARAALRKQLAEEKAAGEKQIQKELAEERADAERLLREEFAEKREKAERDLCEYVAEQKTKGEAPVRERHELPETSDQSSTQRHAGTESFEEFLKRTQGSSPDAMNAARDHIEALAKDGQRPPLAMRPAGPRIELEQLLSELTTQLKPHRDEKLTDVQYAEAEAKRVKAVYSDFYKKYGGQRSLHTFVIENVTEQEQEKFRLGFSSVRGILPGGRARSREAHLNYVGPYSELILSKADALKVNRGDEIYCWVAIDADATTFVCTNSFNGASYSDNTSSAAKYLPYRFNGTDYSADVMSAAQSLPCIGIKDRVVYIASGDRIKLVLCGSIADAKRLAGLTDDKIGVLGGHVDKSIELLGFRVWRDSTGGFSIKAKFIKIEDASVVLQKADLTSTKVRLERLSKADQDYVLEKVKGRRREEGTKAEPFKADGSTDVVEGANRGADARAREDKIATLLQGTIPLDKFLSDELALSISDPSLTAIQNQVRCHRNTEAFVKKMDGKTVGFVTTIKDVTGGETYCTVECTSAQQYFYVRSSLAETLVKGSEVVVKWTAKSIRNDGPRQMDGLGLLGLASEVIPVPK